MLGERERSPALAAPGSNSFTGVVANSTAEVIGTEDDELQAKSEKEANDLCEKYRPLAFKIAGQYNGRGIELDELRSAGLLGLVQASRRFDSSRGIPFGGYAQHWVKGHILELFKPKADAAGLGRARSLDAPAFTTEDEDGNTELERVTDDSEPDAIVDVSALDERERAIVDARLEGKTLEEIGNKLGVSRERVRQISNSSIEKINKTKGKVARACIRDLLRRRGYRKPSYQKLPFKSIKYPGRSYAPEEIAAFVSERDELLAPRSRDHAWWEAHKRSCTWWIGRTASKYRFKHDGPPAFHRWPR